MENEMETKTVMEGFFADYQGITDPTKMNVYLIEVPVKYRYQSLPEDSGEVIQPIINEFFMFREALYLQYKETHVGLAQMFENQNALYPNGNIPASGLIFTHYNERFLLLCLTSDQALFADLCFKDRILKEFSHEMIDMQDQQKELDRFLSLYQQQKKEGWRMLKNENDEVYIVRDLASLSKEEQEKFINFLDSYKIPYSDSQINHRDGSVSDAIVVSIAYRNWLEQSQLLEQGRQEGWGDLKNWRAIKLDHEKVIVTQTDNLSDEQKHSLKKTLKNLGLPFKEQTITKNNQQVNVVVVSAEYVQRFSQKINQSPSHIVGYAQKGLFSRFRGRND